MANPKYNAAVKKKATKTAMKPKTKKKGGK